MATRITWTMEPIVDSLRRTWRGAATPAHSADSTTVAWSTSTPSAASPASAEVFMAAASLAKRTAVSAVACVGEAPAVGRMGGLGGGVGGAWGGDVGGGGGGMKGERGLFDENAFVRAEKRVGQEYH